MPISTTARENLKRALGDLYPRAQPHTEEAAGGFVVALVAPEFETKQDEPQEMHRLFAYLGKMNEGFPNMDDRVAVFSLRFAPSERALFTESASLRTRRNEWSPSGVMTHFAMAGDAHVLAHCLDAEVFLIEPRAKAFCRVVQNPDFKNYPLGMGRYEQFDLAGHSFDVKALEREAESEVWRIHLS